MNQDWLKPQVGLGVGRMTNKMAAGKPVAIVQSAYGPWKFYIHLANRLDERIISDVVEYTSLDVSTSYWFPSLRGVAVA